MKDNNIDKWSEQHVGSLALTRTIVGFVNVALSVIVVFKLFEVVREQVLRVLPQSCSRSDPSSFDPLIVEWEGEPSFPMPKIQPKFIELSGSNLKIILGPFQKNLKDLLSVMYKKDGHHL